MLTNLAQFWSNKSIKLSDSFEVLIQYPNSKYYTELYTCTGFTLPKLEYEEETYEYGNTSQVFLIPKYDSCKELTLDFVETMRQGRDYTHTLSQIFKYMGYEINQLYGKTGLSKNIGTYNIDKIIPSIIIKILDNRLWHAVYKYTFTNLKIVNYTIYNLDYQGDQPCKISVTFSFEGYEKSTINEPINYSSKNTKTETPATAPAAELQNTKSKEEINKDIAKLITDIYADGSLTKEEVKQLQEALGFKGKAADGIAGTNTQNALKKWINENGELLNETMENEGPGAGKVIEYAENGKRKKALGKNDSDMLMNMINQSVIGTGVDGDFGKGSKKALESYKEKHVDEWERTVGGMDDSKEKAEKQAKINAIKEKQKEEHERKSKYESEREMFSNPEFNDFDNVPIPTPEEFDRDVKTELMMAAKAQEQSRGRGPQQPMPNQNTTGGETASEIGMDVLTQKTKEDAYAQLEQKNKETRNMTREPNLNPGAANEEGQWASVEVAEKERQDILVQQERAERDAQNEQMYKATQLAQAQQNKGMSRGPQGLTSNPSTSQNPTESNSQQVAQQEQPKQQTQQKSKMTSNDIQEMAKRAAELDKNDSTLKKGQKGTYLQAGLNAMGLDEKGRSEFMATYNANFTS
jgi:hypothetical protein